MKNIEVFKLRYVKESEDAYSEPLNSPDTVVKAMDELFDMRNLPEEHFFVICLNTKNRIVAISEVGHGTLSSCIVNPVDVFKRALLANAGSIILCHNHPSGNPTPSAEDRKMTERLVDGGKLLNIAVLDHVIIGDSYISFKEQGYL